MKIQVANNKVFVSAPAKLNLFLEVMGLTDNGYHELETIMQTISLHDLLVIEPDDEIRLTCPNMPELPVEENLVWKAAKLIQSTLGQTRGARMKLHKRIPAGSGLGGGSSDAAAALVGLCRLWKVDCSIDRMMDLAVELGSDVPFFLEGGTCLCRGRGQILEPLEVEGTFNYLLAIPPKPNKTIEVYRQHDQSGSYEYIRSDYVLQALKTADKPILKEGLFNRLQQAGCRLNGQVTRGLDILGPGSMMTGSGSACFKVCISVEECAREARRVSPLLDRFGLVVVSNEQTHVFQTLNVE